MQNVSLHKFASSIYSKLSLSLLCLLMLPLLASGQVQPCKSEDRTKPVTTYSPTYPNSVVETVNDPLLPAIDCVTLAAQTKIKVKVAKTLTSGIVRNGDFVELDTLEDVFGFSDKLPNVPRVVIPKGSIVYGRVADRELRIGPLRHGKFHVYIDDQYGLRTIDGQFAQLSISRPQDVNTERNAKNKCKTRDNKDCIAGRVYTTTLVGSIPSAVIAAVSAAVLAKAASNSAKIAGGITLISQVGTQQGLSTIVNGTDQEIDNGDVFEVTVQKPMSITVVVAPQAPATVTMKVLRCWINSTTSCDLPSVPTVKPIVPPPASSTADITPKAPATAAAPGNSCRCPATGELDGVIDTKPPLERPNRQP